MIPLVASLRPPESFTDPVPEHRNARPRPQRARTVTRRELTKKSLRETAELYPEPITWRPRTRAECFDVPRPCPYVGCRYNMYLDVGKKGAIKLNFPDLEPWEMPAAGSCALDAAAQGPHRLEKVGELMNVVRERIRQIQAKAEQKISAQLRRLL